MKERAASDCLLSLSCGLTALRMILCLFCQGAYASANAMFTPKLVRPNWNQDVYRYVGQVTC